MNAIVPAQKPMLLEIMAEKYSLSPDHFRATVRATCGLATATPEQVAAFLIVAKTYNLNPITKEIYAFPGKSGGVVPIVSIDGWVNLVNSHPQCDGFEFQADHDGSGNLVSITCKMHRKDRKFPVEVTEYLSECKRQTEPWKMQHRMLRHKALIQAARYAFGFAGIYDEDEGHTIIDSEPRDVTPAQARPAIPSPSEIEPEDPAHEVLPGEDPNHGTDKYRPGDVITVDQEATNINPYNLPDITKDYDSWIGSVVNTMSKIEDGGELESFFNDYVETRRNDIFPPDMADLAEACGKRQEQLKADR